MNLLFILIFNKLFSLIFALSKKDINKIKRVQRKATKLMPSLYNKPLYKFKTLLIKN